MKFFRKIMVKILGLRGYLAVISAIYITLIKSGFYRKKYAELHFVRNTVKAGDTVLDIGANLGYYSFFLASRVGKKGKLIGVEPIPLFAEVWKKNMKQFRKFNINLENCALGSEFNDSVTMSIPVVNGVVRHGLTRVVENDEDKSENLSFNVPMYVGDVLLQKHELDKLDFIKCDVEGYEQFVIPSLEENIIKFKPLIQIELGGEENRKNVFNFLENLGFNSFILENEKLRSIEGKEIYTTSKDFYFIHHEKMDKWNSILA